VRTLACGGEAVVAPTLQGVLDLLAPQGLRADVMVPSWGMAETSSYYCMRREVFTEGDTPHVHLGAPLRGNATRIVDDADVLLPEGEVGHLQVRGACVLGGYYRDEALDAQSFARDGWFRTGDLAVIRDGSMAITGRQKEVLVLGGENVYPH